jgi:hypothetical protein
MRRQRAACVGLLSSGLLSLASPAFAQDAATAGALFDKGVSDMQAGHFDSACPALEESEQLDPHPGTLFTLAECQAKWGKVASAVQHYQDYADLVSRLPAGQQARHRERVGVARTQLAKLKPSVPTLSLVLPPAAPAGTTVTRNGVLLQGAALGLALPVDPGQYVIVTRLPSGVEHSITVSVALSDAKRVELDISQPDAPVSPPATPPSTPVSSAPPSESPRRSNTLAYAIGGVGVAGIAVGSVTGIMVFGKRSTVKDQCVGTTCSANGVSAANSGKTLAIISDIGFGVGIVGLATSAVLLLTQPKAEASAQSPAPRWEPLLAGTPGGAWAGLGRRF